MMYHHNESLCEPNIRILPDALQSGHWDQRAWEKRCVVGTAQYHLFYTLCADFYGFGCLQGKNSTFGDVVMGDVFMLKVSDGTDEDGLHSYVDVERDDCAQEVLLDLGKKLVDREENRGGVQRSEWGGGTRGVVDTRWCHSFSTQRAYLAGRHTQVCSNHRLSITISPPPPPRQSNITDKTIAPTLVRRWILSTHGFPGGDGVVGGK